MVVPWIILCGIYYTNPFSFLFIAPYIYRFCLSHKYSSGKRCRRSRSVAGPSWCSGNLATASSITSDVCDILAWRWRCQHNNVCEYLRITNRRWHMWRGWPALRSSADVSPINCQFDLSWSTQWCINNSASVLFILQNAALQTVNYTANVITLSKLPEWTIPNILKFSHVLMWCCFLQAQAVRLLSMWISQEKWMVYMLADWIWRKVTFLIS